VVEEEPALRARRGARGWAAWYGSADVLDYATTLVIRLKPAGANATRATFDYIIKHPWLMQSDKAVLMREAEAITALAAVRATDRVCTACGTEATDDSRFCRRCGAPLSSEQAELNILSMSAEACAGQGSVIASAALSLISIVVMLFAWISLALKGTLSTKGIVALIIFGVFSSLLNLVMGLFAWNRLNRALRSKQEGRQVITASGEQPLYGAEPAALPPHLASASVTEGTTALLDAQREREPVRNQRRNDTASIN
jgi:hypothetical protein